MGRDNINASSVDKRRPVPAQATHIDGRWLCTALRARAAGRTNGTSASGLWQQRLPLL